MDAETLDDERFRRLWQQLTPPEEQHSDDNENFQDYRTLDAWRLGMLLADAAYQVAGALPRSEKFELSSQIRRSGASVPANIAEGYGCGHNGTCLYHLRRSRGSAYELETHLRLADIRRLAPGIDFDRVYSLVKRTLSALSGYYQWVEDKIDENET